MTQIDVNQLDSKTRRIELLVLKWMIPPHIPFIQMLYLALYTMKLHLNFINGEPLVQSTALISGCDINYPAIRAKV